MLTKEQEDIVYASERHIRSMSAAGSGKTTTLIGRISHLVDRGVPPEAIMVITFTNRAGRELALRLPDRARGAAVGTFHGVILNAIQRSGRTVHVLDEDEAGKLLDRCANQIGIAINGKYQKHSRRHYQRLISAIRSGRADSCPLYEAYRSSLAISGEIDFDGILHRGVEMAREGAFSWVQELLVDEAQDNEPMQWQFTQAIAKHAGLTLVGDAAQSLYAFRGAVPEQFEKQKYPTYHLTESFRFPSNVADLLNAVGASSFKIFSRKAPVPFRILQQEPAALTDRLVRGGEDPDDIAILCRYNADVDLVRAELISLGIPVVVPRKEQRGQVHDLLILLASPSSKAAREKVTHWRGPSPSVVQWAKSSLPQDSCAQAIKNWLPENKTVGAILGALDLDVSNQPEQSGILRKHSGSSLSRYQIATLEDEWITEGRGVTVGTVHWSKGGEWPIVIVPGLDERRWPKNQNSKEEDRVFHVAASRVQDQLYLLYNQQPGKYIEIAQSVNQEQA